MPLLTGLVEVDCMPSAQKLTGNATENDFADLLAGLDGELWAAWVAYHNQASEVVVRRFNVQAWLGITPLMSLLSLRDTKSNNSLDLLRYLESLG